MELPIYITGSGIVSSIGLGKKETLTSLLSHRSGIERVRYLKTKHTQMPVGEVKRSNEELLNCLGLEDSLLLTRAGLLGIMAMTEALQEAKLTDNDIINSCFINGTTVAGKDERERYYLQEENCDEEHALLATQGCSDCTTQIAEHFGHFSSLCTISTACSSAANAIITGANMLKSGITDIAVVGGTECLSLFHLNGFNTLMNVDSKPCKPFDKNRAGLNLGEGAAYIVLETQMSIDRRHISPLCLLSGYGNACDAYHQTATSPDGDGAFLAMKEALEMAKLNASEIQYVNAHGTGTENNDESELKSMRRIFGSKLPKISSTKGFTGHATSASGSIEAVICILSLLHNFYPINMNWQTPMDIGISPIMDSTSIGEIRHVMNNSFGFGGNDSSIILSKPVK